MNLNLKVKIIERFHTQADFAQSIGADDSLVSRVVRDRRQLSDEKKTLWAKALGCKPEEIFRG